MSQARRHGMIMINLPAMLAGLALFGALVAFAVSGLRQRGRIEAAAARVEEGQNLLARWRAGQPPDAARLAAGGWTASERATAAGCALLELRATGVRLATLRPLAPAAAPAVPEAAP